MARSDEVLTLFLCGDVMPGRAVDQILPHPGDPTLWEPYVADARFYVRSAEEHNGAIAQPVEFAWPWGEALPIIDEINPDARVINLESSVTEDGMFAPDKSVHYRMSRANLPCVTAGKPDVCVLANNHVLDFGQPGLADTLDAVSAAGLRYVGAGSEAAEAARPAIVSTPGRGRLAVLACASTSAGVLQDWAASASEAGVHLLPDLSDRTAARVAGQLHAACGPQDLALVSIHWGSNWGYDVPNEHVRFAHRLIDEGVHVVHGHSSHHPRPIEIYRDRPILYGCGDFIDDYEGIGGHEQYRDDLRVLYFPEMRAGSGELVRLRLAVTQARRMRLHRASTSDVEWMCSTLARVSEPFGVRAELDTDGMITIASGRQR